MRFSIVIPTRNRAQYLRHCLRTCIAQEEKADEIVVCDNSSSEHAIQTAEVVREVGNSAVRYVPPDGNSLNMTDNWNRALAAATGDYVTFIGDDDALLPSCVRVAKMAASLFDCDAFRWGWAFFHWPCFRYRGLAGRGFTPLPCSSDTVFVRRLTPSRLVSRVVDGTEPYVSLPMLYNSFVHRRVLAVVGSDGKPPLDAQSPDIYSGLAIAVASTNVVSTPFPLAIAGQSCASNGAAHENRDQTSQVAQEFIRLNESQRIGKLKGTIQIGKLSLAVTDAFVRLKGRYPDRMARFSQNQRSLARWQASDVGEIVRESQDVNSGNAAITSLIEHFASVYGSKSAIHRGYAAGLARDPTYPPPGVYSDQLFFDGKTFQASSVADVAAALGGVVGSPRNLVAVRELRLRLEEMLPDWLPFRRIRF